MEILQSGMIVAILPRKSVHNLLYIPLIQNLQPCRQIQVNQRMLVFDTYAKAKKEWKSKYGEKSIHRKLAEKQTEVKKRE